MKKVAARLLVLAMGFAVALVVCEVFVRVAKPQVRYITRDELPPSVRLPAGPYTAPRPSGARESRSTPWASTTGSTPSNAAGTS